MLRAQAQIQNRIFALRDDFFSLRAPGKSVKRTLVQVSGTVLEGFHRAESGPHAIDIECTGWRENFELCAVNCKLSPWLTVPFSSESCPKPSFSNPATRFPGCAKRATFA
jgi:hypothetical protein